MRELSVYYCRKCGRYAYYQLSKNAVCPKCALKMTMLSMPYQEFMDLDCEQRDHLITNVIIDTSSSYVQRITAPEKMYNHREVIGGLIRQIDILEADNKKLNETVTWMHATIWEQLGKLKALELELNQRNNAKPGKE